MVIIIIIIIIIMITIIIIITIIITIIIITVWRRARPQTSHNDNVTFYMLLSYSLTSLIRFQNNARFQLLSSFYMLLSYSVTSMAVSTRGSEAFRSGRLLGTHRYRCLQNKRPLEKHMLQLSNTCPPKINVGEVTSGSGSACKISGRFRKTGSALAFQL